MLLIIGKSNNSNNKNHYYNITITTTKITITISNRPVHGTNRIYIQVNCDLDIIFNIKTKRCQHFEVVSPVLLINVTETLYKTPLCPPLLKSSKKCSCKQA